MVLHSRFAIQCLFSFLSIKFFFEGIVGRFITTFVYHIVYNFYNFCITYKLSSLHYVNVMLD